MINVHLSPHDDGDDRRREAALVVDAARRLPRLPVIAGDCNDAAGRSRAGRSAALPGGSTRGRSTASTDVDGSTNWTAGDAPRPPAHPATRLRVRAGRAGRVVDAAVLAPAERLDWFAERSDHLPLVGGHRTAPGDDELRRLLDKIRKLLAKAEGTDNANEAEAFSAKAAQLIAEHRIDPRHVRDALAHGVARPAPDRHRPWRVRPRPAGPARRRRPQPRLRGRVRDRSGTGTTAVLAGYESDLDVTEVLYTSLHAQAASQMAGVRSRTPAATQRWRRSFLFGFANRVAEQLAAARARAAASATAPSRGAARPARTALPDVLARSAGSASSPPTRSVVSSPPGPPLRRSGRAGATVTVPPPTSTSAGRASAVGWRWTGRSRDAESIAARAAVAAAEEMAFGGTELDVAARSRAGRSGASPRSRRVRGGVRAARRSTVATPRAGRARRALGIAPDHVEIQLSDEQLTRSPRSPTSLPTPSPASTTATTTPSAPPTSTSWPCSAARCVPTRSPRRSPRWGLPPAIAVGRRRIGRRATPSG